MARASQTWGRKRPGLSLRGHLGFVTGGFTVSEYKFVPKFGPESPHPIQSLSAHDPRFCQPKTRPSPEESSEVPGYSLVKEGVSAKPQLLFPIRSRFSNTSQPSTTRMERSWGKHWPRNSLQCLDVRIPRKSWCLIYQKLSPWTLL